MHDPPFKNERSRWKSNENSPKSPRFGPRDGQRGLVLLPPLGSI
jgi:hypothetical protein